MATNKRKEAAALFELIDKSTLKVPKHAGALKIPDWWSSKTNPTPPAPGTPATPAAPSPTAGSAFPSKTTTSPPKPPAKNGEAGTHVNGSNEPAAPQSRLFAPPPAAEKPAASPSIRPPSAASPPPAVRSPSIAPPPPPPPATAPVSSGQARQTVELAPDEDPDAPPTELRVRETITTPPSNGDAGPRRPFGPATMDPSAGKHQWTSGRQRNLARTPMWVVVTGAALVLLVLVLLGVVVMKSRHKAKSAETASETEGTGETGIPPTGTAGSLLMSRAGTSQTLTANPPSRGNLDVQPKQLLPQQAQEPAPPSGDQGVETGAKGVVYGPGEVKRSPELYYIMIASSPSKMVAERNAKFLADHGVSVAVEVTNDKGVMYRLLSADGYPTLVAAEPHIKQIVRIGHETLDYKKSHKAWDDAFARKFNR